MDYKKILTLAESNQQFNVNQMKNRAGNSKLNDKSGVKTDAVKAFLEKKKREEQQKANEAERRKRQLLDLRSMAKNNRKATAMAKRTKDNNFMSFLSISEQLEQNEALNRNPPLRKSAPPADRESNFKRPSSKTETHSDSNTKSSEKKTRSVPPPKFDYSQLLNLAANKQYQPVNLPKIPKKTTDVDVQGRLMTIEEKKRFLEEQARKQGRSINSVALPSKSDYKSKNRVEESNFVVESLAGKIPGGGDKTLKKSANNQQIKQPSSSRSSSTSIPPQKVVKNNSNGTTKQVLVPNKNGSTLQKNSVSGSRPQSKCNDVSNKSLLNKSQSSTLKIQRHGKDDQRLKNVSQGPKMSPKTASPNGLKPGSANKISNPNVVPKQNPRTPMKTSVPPSSKNLPSSKQRPLVSSTKSATNQKMPQRPIGSQNGKPLQQSAKTLGKSSDSVRSNLPMNSKSVPLPRSQTTRQPTSSAIPQRNSINSTPQRIPPSSSVQQRQSVPNGMPQRYSNSELQRRPLSRELPQRPLSRELPQRPLSRELPQRPLRGLPPARRPMPSSRPPMKRRIESDDEYDEEMEDFIDDGPVDGQDFDYSSHIRDIFKYDRSKYINDVDDDIMESSFAQQMKEEAYSTRAGIMEDLEDIQREQDEMKRNLKRRRLK